MGKEVLAHEEVALHAYAVLWCSSLAICHDSSEKMQCWSEICHDSSEKMQCWSEMLNTSQYFLYLDDSNLLRAASFSCPVNLTCI